MVLAFGLSRLEYVARQSTIPLLLNSFSTIRSSASITRSMASLSPTTTSQGMPIIGIDAVVAAMKDGYKHIDCAQIYQNQEEVGHGIRESIQKGYIKDPSEIYVVSKLWCTELVPQDVRPATQRILRELDLPKIQQLLIHWPVAWSVKGTIKEHDFFPKNDKGQPDVLTDVDLAKTWSEMEKLVDDGLVETIGVSNFNEKELDHILKNARIKPKANQIECHPYWQQDQMREYLKKHDIALVAYSPLCNFEPDDPKMPTPLTNESVKKLAQKYKKTPAQLVLRWGLQKGNVIIPKSVHANRIKEDFNVFDFQIDEGDMASLGQIGKENAIRVNNPGFGEGGKKIFG